MKRKSSESNSHGRKKKKKTRNTLQDEVNNTVLARFYTKTASLRDYLLTSFPELSKRCKRRLKRSNGSQERESCKILDDLVVGVTKWEKDDEVQNDLEVFSQQVTSPNEGIPITSPLSSLSELLDFAIWRLFNRRYPTAPTPPHILCRGLSRACATWQNGCGISAGSSIPGIAYMIPNEHLEAIKGPEWLKLMQILGHDAAKVMMHLVLDCGLFVPLHIGSRTFYQLSGTCLSDMEPQTRYCRDIAMPLQNFRRGIEFERSTNEIKLVRNRMFFARAALNAKGTVMFGLRHIHVLNRYPNPSSEVHTIHIMKYIFPRQFGLHNVFTSQTDKHETSQPFKDYTLREDEIGTPIFEHASRVGVERANTPCSPRRLRSALPMIASLQNRHGKCPYVELFRHYCANPVIGDHTLKSSHEMGKHIHFAQVATPHSKVAAFCKAVIDHVWPISLFGEDDVAEHNWEILMRNVDNFIMSRKYEAETLESLLRSMKLKNIKWLCPPKVPENCPASLTDFRKRREIFAELIYYIFDSFLIPLIRSNFHVTESGANKNRLYYFRHDVWRTLTEPAIRVLKTTLFEEIPAKDAVNTHKTKALPVSTIRLLPKERGMRIISNLRRRPQILQNGRRVLGKSANSILGPVYQVMRLEKERQPSRLGSAIFSTADIYNKLSDFQNVVFRSGEAKKTEKKKQLFFVKVDVKSCFDSIPQHDLVELLRCLLESNEYKVRRHTEIKLNDGISPKLAMSKVRPMRIFRAQASATGCFEDFGRALQTSKPRKDSVLIDAVTTQSTSKARIMKLIQEHVEGNIVKIGKKCFTSKRGIPQGSVLSSLLCSLFYGDFEVKHLHFLSPDESLLLRLIDDFLLITTSLEKARRFLQIMHDGVPSHNIIIQPEKTLVNFPAIINDIAIPQVEHSDMFPYCGMLINCRSLNISKDADILKDSSISDSLTIEYSRSPGLTFRRKMLGALKLHLHTMLLDTRFNKPSTVVQNLYQVMHEIASKTVNYMGCLRNVRDRAPRLLIRTVRDLSSLAFAMAKSKRNRDRSVQYECCITKDLMRLITASAFHAVFSGRQTQYSEFIGWVAKERRLFEFCSAKERSMLKAAMQ